MIKKFLIHAAKELATNPKLREELAGLVKDATPRLVEGARKIGDSHRENPLHRDPKGFLRGLRDRFSPKDGR